MRLKKTPLENELDKYYYAAASIKRWQDEFGRTTSNYELKMGAISQLIDAENETIKRINNLISRANLSGEERTYIELKHFKQYNRIQIERAMFCCQTTINKIRKSALEKIEKVYKKGD